MLPSSNPTITSLALKIRKTLLEGAEAKQIELQQDMITNDATKHNPIFFTFLSTCI